MGYNYAEAFQENELNPEIESADGDSIEQEEDNGEHALHMLRVKQIQEKIKNIIQDVDSETAQIIKTTVNYKFTSQNKQLLDEEMEKISEEADQLINSADAQTPEVLKKRKVLANKMNDLIIIDETISERLKKLHQEYISNKFISEDKHTQARTLIASVLEDIKRLKNPIDVTLN